MKIGITGLSQSGKTTIFNALTGAHAATGEYYHGEGSAKANISVVKFLTKDLTIYMNY